MNDVPLVKDNNINSINTSIIAIKKQLRQIVEAVGLIDIPDMPDLSPFVRKDEVVDTVQSGNNNPVTSNAVDNLNSTQFRYYTGVDVLATAESQPIADKVYFMRIFEATANSPYGSNSNDFWYYVNRIGDANWMQIIAYDVRSSNDYIRTKQNGTWWGWISLNTRVPSQSVVTDYVSSGGGSYGLLERSGYIVKCVWRFNKESAVSFTDGQVLGNIPQGFRPSFYQPCPVTAFDVNGAFPTYLGIGTDGNITTIPWSASRLDVYLNLMWFTT